MSPLSSDLRRRIIQAWRAEKPRVADLAARFSVGTAAVKRLIQRFRETGSVEPRPHGGGQRPKIPAEKLPRVQRLLEANPDWSVDELAAAYNRQEGTTVSRSTMVRTIARLGFTRKKKSLVAKERNTERIAAWRKGFLKTVRAITPSRLVFVDETGTHTSMTREYARGPSGERVVGIVPRNRAPRGGDQQVARRCSDRTQRPSHGEASPSAPALVGS